MPGWTVSLEAFSGHGGTGIEAVISRRQRVGNIGWLVGRSKQARDGEAASGAATAVR
jgi:hypothetical protein